MVSENDNNNCETNVTETCFIPDESEQEVNKNIKDEMPKRSCDTVTIAQNSELKACEIVKVITSDRSPEKNLQPNSQPVCTNSDEVNNSGVSENSTSPNSVNSSVSKIASDEFETLTDIPNECIDFLLEKSYNDQVKCKSNFKRKIDNLLKLKQSKACKLANDLDAVDNSKDDKNASESVTSETAIKIQSVENISEKSKPEIISESSNSQTDPPKDKKITKSISLCEKADKSPVSEQSEIMKTSQSVEEIQNVEMPNDDNESDTFTKNTQSSTFAFQSLPDIPTELLKNILDKSRVSMNIPVTTDLTVSNDKGVNSTSEFSDITSSCNNKNDGTLSNLNASITTQSGLSEDKISEISKSVKDSGTKSKDLLDNHTSTCDTLKDSLINKEIVSSHQIVENNPSVNSTYFLDRLQNVLQCFTKKETAFQGVKTSQALNFSPSIPLENTLRIFNCLMLNGTNVDSVSDSQLDINMSSNSNNSHLGLSQEDMVNCSNFTSEVKNSLNETTQHDTNVKTEFSESFVFSSKDDNLEIMDMEVDSEDEGMK